MLVTSSIPNLINGVSEQPDTLRLSSQAEEQTNFRSRVSEGLIRRPGSRHVAKITNYRLNNAFLHTINRDAAERYDVVIDGYSIRIFDAATGAEKVVNAPNGYGYIGGGNRDTLRAVTVADYTFIVNMGVVPQMETTLSPIRPNTALAYFRAGNYSRNYSVSLASGAYGNFYTPDGSSVAHGGIVRPGNIAAEVLISINALGGMAAEGVTVVRRDDILELSRSDAAPFLVSTSDDAGGAALSAINYQIQRFSDLPKVAVEGFVTEVTGDQSSGFDNYHVRYRDGVWEETLKGGEQYRIAPWSMPYILVREADGSFTFKQAAWADRKVGDLAKMPIPSFIGRKISDVFFHRNRLGFLAGENVILSKMGEFFDFHRDTATTTLDTDPIDIAVTNSKVSDLNFAVPFSKTLMLFSDNAQFVLESGDILSAEAAFISQSTEYPSAPFVRPAGLGKNMYFPSDRGKSTALLEYFTDGYSDTNGSTDVTSHCPRYIPKGVVDMTSSASQNMIVLLSSVEPTKLFVYEFFATSEGKLQSAWSTWMFDQEASILAVEFIDDDLHMVVDRPDGAYIERLNMEAAALDVGASFHYHIDRGLRVYGTFDGVNTTFTLPYTSWVPKHLFIGGGDGMYPEGLLVPFTQPSGNTLVCPGDFSGRNTFVGVRMQSSYTFSKFFVKSQAPGGGVISNDDGRLQIKNLFINYSRAGYFEVSSTPYGRPTSRRIFSGRTVGSGSARTGSIELTDGRFTVPVLCRNTYASITIHTDSIIPCGFTSAEWEGNYTPRAKRI